MRWLQDHGDSHRLGLGNRAQSRDFLKRPNLLSNSYTKLSIASKPKTNLNLSNCRDSNWLLHMPMEDKTLRGSMIILGPNCVKFLMFSSQETYRVNTSVFTDHNGSD